jgi:hypothetical protein
MPNWCNNSATITGPIDILKELEAVQLSFQELFPCPQELLDTTAPAVYNDKDKVKINEEKFGYSDWYSWQVGNWGTKWDLSLQSLDLDDNGDGTGCLHAGFDTAWSPPVEFMKNLYEKYKDRGLNIRMEYFEPGCGFLGIVDTSEGEFIDEYHEFETASELEDCIKELGEHCLAKYELEYLQEREEEERQEREKAEEAKTEEKVTVKAAAKKSAKTTVKKAAAKKTVKKAAVKKAAVKKAASKKAVKAPASKKSVKK